MKLVHCPLMDGLLHLVHGGQDWVVPLLLLKTTTGHKLKLVSVRAEVAYRLVNRLRSDSVLFLSAAKFVQDTE